jgi:perosamine synthetase
MIQLFRPFVSEEAISAVAEVLRSGWIGLGPKTAQFEEAFAAYVGAKHAVALTSATAAIHLAVVAAGIGEGDEVLTTPLTFVSTNQAILYEGGTPVFVDVDEGTLNLDLNKAEALLSPRTKAIIVVHYGGNPIDEARLYAFAAAHGLVVIEDAAHACGATFEGRRVGSFGLTCFSFHAVKNLPLGDGGMITTDDELVYQRLQRLRWLGIDRSTFSRTAGGYQWEYDVPELGYKYHMNDIAAAIGLEHLKSLDEWNERRRALVQLYREELSGLPSDVLRFVDHTPGAVSANHLCVVRVANRDRVVDRLREREISVGVHYKPNHHYPMFSGARRGDLSCVERAYHEILSLPMHLLLSDDDVRTVARALRAVLASGPAVVSSRSVGASTI